MNLKKINIKRKKQKYSYFFQKLVDVWKILNGDYFQP